MGGTRIFWPVAVALGVRFDSAVGLVLLLVGLAVPGVAGILFIYLDCDERRRSDFWNRVVNPRRVGLRWLGVTLLVPLCIGVIAGGIVAIWGAKTVTAADEVPYPPLPSTPSLGARIADCSVLTTLLGRAILYAGAGPSVSTVWPVGNCPVFRGGSPHSIRV